MATKEEKQKIGIEEYSRLLPQYYSIAIPKTLKKYLDKTSFKSLIDCGCGDGQLLYALKENGYFSGKKIIAVDLSEKRINLIKKLDSHIEAYVDSAETLKKIQDNSIDFLMSKHVIEHVNDKRMMQAIERITKKGSVLYIATVFKKWYGWYYYRKNGKWVMDVTHLREYSKDEELLDKIDRKKFKILETKKSLLYFPIIDFLIRRLYMSNVIKDRELFTNNIIFNLLRKIQIPVPGYYNWEIVLEKK